MIPIIFWMITSIENSPTDVQKDAENQPWKGFSVFLHVLLPIAGLALLWGQRGIFSKLLLQLDRSCVAVYCPSFSKREKLLKWASNRLPSTWSSQARTLSSGIPELWKDGSLLCTLINSVVPGACPNPHRHWRKPPLHAQALAFKYLGLVPIFTEEEFAAEFTIGQEKKFINYLQKLQEAINKWTARDETNRKFSSQYVARGMGLYTGDQNRKTVFYVYSNATTKKRSNVLLYIRGPYGTQGKATISPFHNLKTIPVVNVLQDQLKATKLLPFKNEEQNSLLKTISLDFTSLISNTEEKGEKNDIPIQIDMEIDRAKVTYIPMNSGMYEINLICDGELLRGSPYMVQVIKNATDKTDSFDADCENIEEKITFTKRKILSKVIDCIDEKICIDNDKVSKFRSKESQSSESDSDDLKITAVTKKNGEILKTEINCTLEGIIEEINSVQNDKDEDNKQVNALDEIKKIAEQLKTEVSHIVDANEGFEETDSVFQVDSQHKIVESCEEVKTEIINILQKEPDLIDSKFLYNVETEKNIEPPPKTLVSKLDIGFVKPTEYFKDMVKSNKEKFEEEINKFAPQKRIKSKIQIEITPKSLSRSSTSVSFPEDTSPICPEHIAPEVETNPLSQLTLSEKRKIFSKQDSFNIQDSDNSLSIPENEESSRGRNSNFRELSVLNVLDSLRQSPQNNFSESHSLSSVSLPNMVDTSYENINENTFRARKEYWERMSFHSSSSSLTNSDYSTKKDRVVHKNIINKYHTIGRIPSNEEVEVTKTLDCPPKQEINNNVLKSDSSLEDCTLIPLKERKKQLLRNMYQKETQVPKKSNIKLNFFKKVKKPKPEEKESDDFPTKNEQEEVEKTSTKLRIKSQFKKAINFFKNLEGNNKISDVKEPIKRRYSLDFQKKHSRKVRTGSLNLSNISDRFSVNNLYEDVFGNKNGFKGTPNKTEVVKSLASVASTQLVNSETIEENTISYNLFANKTKNKKRKSIRSIFDVNY